MATASTAAIGERRELLPEIFLGGMTAGALDLSFACLNARLRGGFGPSMVLKAIASGLLGTHALFRGTGIAFLGLVLHFYIAFIWAAFFAVAALRWPILARHAVLCGALYGVFIFVVMKWIVLPLSAYPKPLWRNGISFGQLVLELAAHILLVGLPIALSVRYFTTRAANVHLRTL
jgi:uncharacterized membrane protein YagU involved in acid resistance